MVKAPTCLFINNSPQPGRKDLAKLGGGGKSLLGLLDGLPAAGWRAHVVVPGEGQFTDALVERGMPHTIYPFAPVAWRRPLSSLAGTAHWYALIRKIRPALIHANGFDLSHSFAPAAALAGVPYITHVRFPPTPEGARWTLRFLPKPAAFVFNSRAMEKMLWPMLRALAPESRTYVVHNAVDIATFAPAPWPESEALRVGMVANFAPFKRHEDFLHMAAEMLSARRDLEFWIVGDDTEGQGRRAVLERLAFDLGIVPHVRFLGHRADVSDLLAQLHLLVVPSQFEPFGRVVIEAMARGRPVIGSRAGGIPEIIDEGETGHLVEVGDVAGFARAALALLADRPRWEAMSRRAAEVARTRFALPAHVRAITAIYEEILRDR